MARIPLPRSSPEELKNVMFHGRYGTDPREPERDALQVRPARVWPIVLLVVALIALILVVLALT